MTQAEANDKERRGKDRDKTQDLYHSLVDKQLALRERMVFYVAALSVSSIGYSVHLTIEERLNPKMWFLAFAILCWFLSTSFAFCFAYYLHQMLLKNSKFLLENLSLDRPKTWIEFKKDNPDLTTSTKLSTRFFFLTAVAYMIGAVAFVIWRLLEMV